MSRFFLQYDKDKNIVGKRSSSAEAPLTGEGIIEVPETEFKTAIVKPAPDPPPTYREQRRNEYPSIEDQLDALWKGGAEAAQMKRKILAVKAKYPKEK